MRISPLAATAVSLTLAAAAAPVHADVVGFGFGAGAWRTGYSGTVSDNGNESFDVEDDLDIEDSTDGYFWVAVEHPLPLFPNLRLARSGFSTDGDGTVTRGFSFGDITVGVDEEVSSTVDLDQTDAILYYELLDNVASVDAGLNVRFLDGSVRVTRESTGESERRSFSAPVPLAWGRVRVDLPGSDVWLGAEGTGMAFDGNRILDLRATVGYEFGFGLGVEAGYRRESLTLDDVDDISADVDAGGPFAGAYLDF